MDPTATPGEIRIDLFVRSLQPPNWQAKQRRVLDRLEALAEGDVVDEFDVYVWGASAPPSPEDARTAFGRFVLDRIATFRQWARANDRSLGGLFEVREADSSITGESCRRLTLPAIVMAEYYDGQLGCVTPHERTGETIRVLDRATELGVRPESTSGLRRIDPSDREERALPVGVPDRRPADREVGSADRERQDRDASTPDAGDVESTGEDGPGLERRQ